MFRAAQIVVRHKVLVVGALAVGFMVLGRNENEDKPVSPWATQSVAEAAAKPSLTDRAFTAVAGAAKDYAGIDIGGVAPDKLRKSTVENWDNTADAARRANGN